MIARTGFPEYIESIAIGPDINFLKNNTSLCDVAEEFPIELQLAYKWRSVTSSLSILPELRNYVKYLTANGTELDTETLIYFRDKLDRLPSRFKYKVLEELENAFNKAPTLVPITTPVNDFSNDQIDEDRSFLGKLADLLKNCNSPCNYFRAYGDTIGTVFDISRNNNTNTEPSSVDKSRPPATHVGMNIFNKMHTVIRDSYAQMCARAGAVWDEIKTSKPSIVKSDTSAYTSVTNVYSDALSKVKRRTQDCFRLYDYNNRYNAYNAEMNLGFARSKYFNIATRLGSLNEQTITYSVDPDGNLKDSHIPVTTASNALNPKAYNLKSDDSYIIFKSTSTSVSGVSALVGSNELRFTTYGLYDAKDNKPKTGDTMSNQGFGGSVLKSDGHYKVIIDEEYTDESNQPLIVVALSRTAVEKYGFKLHDWGQTFTLQDANGVTKKYMYADESPQADANIDIADYTSLTFTQSQKFLDKTTEYSNSKSILNGDSRNAVPLILTKTEKIPVKLRKL
jgi:hypothetical protein